MHLLNLFGSSCGSAGRLLGSLLCLLCLPAALLIGSFRLEGNRTETIWNCYTHALFISTLLYEPSTGSAGGEGGGGKFSQERHAMSMKEHNVQQEKPHFFLIGQTCKHDLNSQQWVTIEWHWPILRNHFPLMYIFKYRRQYFSADVFSECTCLALKLRWCMRLSTHMRSNLRVSW